MQRVLPGEEPPQQQGERVVGSESRGVTPGDDFRAGAGGATDTSPGEDGGTLGTGGSRREQDQ